MENTQVGFEAMGKPIPEFRKANGLNFCRNMGMESNKAWELIGKVSEQLERDEIYNATKIIQEYGIDITGMYRK